MGETEVHVTLVHGTFAQKTTWVDPAGPMSQALIAAGATTEAFRWSGGNSHRARIAAAQGLADRLRIQREAQPEVRQAVVAHSHGGNVAAHAVWRLLNLRDASIQVVALATLFLFARRRQVHVGVLLFSAYVFLIGMWALVLQLTAPGRDSFDAIGRPSNTLEVVVYFSLAGLILVQIAALLYWVGAHGWIGSTSSRTRFLERVQCPEVDGSTLLVIRAADDEASISLALAQFSGWVGSTVMRISRPRIWLPACFVIFAILTVLGLTTPGEVGDSLSSAAIRLFDTAGILALIIVSVPALISLICLGPDGPTTSLFALVSAESTPAGLHVIRQRQARDRDAPGLSHSSLYNDPQVVALIVEYLTTDDRQT